MEDGGVAEGIDLADLRNAAHPTSPAGWGPRRAARRRDADERARDGAPVVCGKPRGALFPNHRVDPGGECMGSSPSFIFFYVCLDTPPP
jgi:hypothetical protein